MLETLGNSLDVKQKRVEPWTMWGLEAPTAAQSKIHTELLTPQNLNY